MSRRHASLIRGEADARAVLGFLRDPDAPTGPEAKFEVTSEDFLVEWSNTSKGSTLWASAEGVIEKGCEKLVEVRPWLDLSAEARNAQFSSPQVQSRNCADTAR